MALAKLGLAESGLIAGTYDFFRVFFERKRAAGGERKFGRISVSAWYSTEEFREYVASANALNLPRSLAILRSFLIP